MPDSSLRWTPARPNALVVACSDGRLQEATDAFLAREFKITWGPRWARVTVYVIVFYAVLWVLHAITPGWWWAGE